MKRVTAMVFFGILAAAYSAEELNLTSLIELTGKMPRSQARNWANCIVFIYNGIGNKIGLGVALQHGQLILHKKFEPNVILYGITFACREYMKLKASSLGSYKSVALMKIDPAHSKYKTHGYSYLPWTKLGVKRPRGAIIAKSVTIDDTIDESTFTKESLITRIVILTSGWRNEFHRTRKLEENNSEKEGDLLFCGSTIMGILVKMPDSDGVTEYQKLMHIHQEVRSHAGTSTSGTVYE